MLIKNYPYKGNTKEGIGLKKIRCLTMAVILLLTAGLASCGHDNDEGLQSADNSSKSEPVSTAEINTDSTDAPTSETETVTELPTAAETEVILDENGEPLFISEDELPTNLKNKIYELLRAAAAHDEEAYLDAFDIEAYAKAKPKEDQDFEEQCIGIRNWQTRHFNELSEAFVGGFRESVENVHVVYMEEEDGTYYVSFTTDVDNGKLLIDCDAYKYGDTWFAALNLWRVADYAYYDYEPLILEELIAAANGDKEAYLNCVDVEMLNVVNTALLLDGDDPSALDEETKSELREITEYICDNSFEDLSAMLGENFDGSILQVQDFAKKEDITLPNGELYGRIVLTVRDSENEFQEVEGYAYTINGKKGVWLQPD